MVGTDCVNFVNQMSGGGICAITFYRSGAGLRTEALRTYGNGKEKCL
jgi:hypothetical protein